MKNDRIRLRLIYILADAAILFSLYQLISAGLKRGQPMSLWLFALMAVLVLLVDLKLKNRSRRNLLLFLFNFTLLTASFVMLLLTNVYGLMSFVLTMLLVAALIFRCLIVSQKNSTDPFGHFDSSMLFIGVILLIAGTLKLSIGSGISLLFLSFLLNVATLSLARGQYEGRLAWYGAGIAVAVLLPVFLLARQLLPMLFAPAQAIYQLGKPVAFALRDLLGFFLSGYSSHLAQQRSESSELAQDTNTIEPMSGPAFDSPIITAVVKGISILVLVLLAVLVLFMLYAFLRSVISWLLRRQGKKIPTVLLPGEKLSFKALWRAFLMQWGRLAVIFLPLLPVRIDIAKAYRALLKWGYYNNHPRCKNETPHEYQQRLQDLFPGKKEELGLLTENYVRYEYGQTCLEDQAAQNSKQLKQALRRLFLPGFASVGANKG